MQVYTYRHLSCEKGAEQGLLFLDQLFWNFLINRQHVAYTLCLAMGQKARAMGSC